MVTAALLSYGPSANAQGAALVFKWAKLSGAVAYVIEVATDKSFSNKVANQRVSGTQFRLKNHSGPGYWWRVRAIDRDGRFGPFSAPRYAVRQVSAPALSSPVNGKQYQLRAATTSVKLRWKADDRLGRYTVVVASDANFGSIIAQRTVRGRPTTTVAIKGVGTFWWRVGGVTQTGRAIAPGKARRFVVAALAPTVVGPSNGAWVRMPASGSGRTTLKFSGWGIKRFALQVASSADFSDATTVTANGPGDGSTVRASYRLLRPGRYVWRVRGIQPATKWSARGSFKVVRRQEDLEIIAPDPGATVGLRHTGANKLAVLWKGPRNLARFDVEIFDEGSGNRRTYSTMERQLTLDLTGELWSTSGPRAVRVRGWGSGKKGKATSWSPPLNVVVTLPPVLTAPLAITSGPDGSGVDWGPVDGAKSYESQECDSQVCSPGSPIAASTSGPAIGTATGHSGWYRIRAVDRWGRPGAWSSVLAVGTRVDKGTDPAEPSGASGEVHRLDVGLGVGVLYNFGGLVSPEPRLEVTYWPPILDNRLGFSLSAGYATASNEIGIKEQGLTLSTSVHTVPVSVSVLTRFGWDPVDLTVGGGLRMTPVFATIDGLSGGSKRSSSVQWGGALFVGIEGRLGPGRLFLEVGYAKSTPTEGLVIVEPSGFSSTIGYRLEVL